MDTEENKELILVDDLIETKSSNVNQIAYQMEQNKVFVLFKNGSLYEYEKVEFEDYENLKKAESIGKHLNKVFLKKNYKYKKLINCQLSHEATVEAVMRGIEDFHNNNFSNRKFK